MSTIDDDKDTILRRMFLPSELDASAQLGEDHVNLISFINEVTRDLVDRLTLDAIALVKKLFPVEYQKFEQVRRQASAVEEQVDGVTLGEGRRVSFLFEENSEVVADAKAAEYK